MPVAHVPLFGARSLATPDPVVYGLGVHQMRRILAALLALLFVEEDPLVPYAVHWVSPFGWVHDVFFLKMPHQVRPFDHVLLVCLLMAGSRADSKGPRVGPMRSTLLLSVATIVIWFIYGLARGGGDLRFGCWQIYIPLSGVLFAFTITAVFRTPEHYAILAKALLVAAAYRAVMAVAFYVFVVRAGSTPYDYMTSHDDSVLWVVALMILLLHILRTTSRGERMKATLFALLIMIAIQLNNRRLAWVSLVMGLVVFFMLLPPGRAKRRITRTLSYVTPILLLYVAIGWGRPERVFTPLRSFSSITTVEDESTKSRNYENMGLITTARNSGWLIGGGWGHEYTPLSMRYQLNDVFPIWRFIPHNSILGIFAFTGALGYAGYWLAFPTAMFLNARMGRMGNSQAARDLGIIGAAQMVVCVNQYFGDMGWFSYKVVYVMSTSFAIALRSPIAAGVWNAAGAKVARKSATREPAAQGQRAPQARVPEDAWES
jgi:hypothetical protein